MATENSNAGGTQTAGANGNALPHNVEERNVDTSDSLALTPRLNHSVLLTEEGGEVLLHLKDESGSGYGVKLYLSPVAAHRLGYRLMERARFLVSKPNDDPHRQHDEEFNAQTAIDALIPHYHCMGCGDVSVERYNLGKCKIGAEPCHLGLHLKHEPAHLQKEKPDA